MKKLLLACFLAAGISVQAQIETPQPSPSAKLEQTVGLTKMTVEYSRPAMRGRKIFGELVPFGKVWRTGANANTKISFSDDITIGGTSVKAGEYAIFVKPSAQTWEVMLYNETTNWGTPGEWDDTKVVATAVAPVNTMPYKTESFTIAIGNLSNGGADLTFSWDKTYVVVPFTVPTDKKTTASIEKVMAGASAGDYFSAARYFLEEGKDISKAKMWIDKAIEMTKEQPRFWYLRQQSLIYAKMGQKADAIKIAKESMALAEKAGNADYVKMNKDSIKKWSK
ncbi:DUF2911 domain-containing protein [Kordia sp. YSTF-M3]|uniref:DUF2911 domain-containing protein n=1 Tax=Kordia aestuariivivens TaxID=2759037 RepID=A0ABR7Q655_9FLAO|nr:DUF2911 domain-containing protein [Kordia aestuariivivens]MBC8754020.1 DUF2911 domain-containing protein [Kordia aestuariivivens]